MSFKEPRGQVARWLEGLQEYDYKVEHRPGKLHQNPDALSRRPRRHNVNCPSCSTITQPLISVVSAMPAISPSTLAIAQCEDPEIGPVITQLRQKWEKPDERELQSVSRATR